MFQGRVPNVRMVDGTQPQRDVIDNDIQMEEKDRFRKIDEALN